MSMHFTEDVVSYTVQSGQECDVQFQSILNRYNSMCSEMCTFIGSLGMINGH